MPRLQKRIRRQTILPARALADRVFGVLGARRHRGDFESVERFCIFLGDGRSGSSILGALLDAHPEAVIAHELNVLERLEASVSRDRLFYELLRNSRRAARRGRQATGYQYDVPNQWQGRSRRVRVIGDKKAGGSSKILARHPERIDELEALAGVELRGIHALRNPFDNITTIARRRTKLGEVGREDLEAAIGSYFERTETIARLRRRRADHILDVRHEEFIADPKGRLRAICSFLGLEAEDRYLEDCASIVYTNANRSRDTLDWPRELISTVEAETRKHDFLAGYTWES